MFQRPVLRLTTAALVGLALGVGLGFAISILRPGKPLAPAGPQPSTAAPEVVFRPTDLTALPGWDSDRVIEVLPALAAACQVFSRRPETEAIGAGPLSRPASLWHTACRGLTQAGDEAALRSALVRDFAAYAVVDTSHPDAPDRGLFTGYYEAELTASLTRDGRYRFPVYGTPRDLVTVDLPAFLPEFPASSPRQLVGHVVPRGTGQALAPYFTRAEIDGSDAIAGAADVLVWADDPVAVHILHIQGSGRAHLPDGRTLRLGFAGHNGHGFRGIGKILLDEGALKPGQAGMDRVRAWLHEHPAAAAGYMNRNARYIFFRIQPASDTDGPLGSLGVPLPAGRALAVDPRTIPLGAPVWLDTTDADGKPLQRLMVALDTGAAITGAVRGDVFWGFGEPAFAQAARMKSPGRYVILVPCQPGSSSDPLFSIK